MRPGMQTAGHAQALHTMHHHDAMKLLTALQPLFHFAAKGSQLAGVHQVHLLGSDSILVIRLHGTLKTELLLLVTSALLCFCALKWNVFSRLHCDTVISLLAHSISKALPLLPFQGRLGNPKTLADSLSMKTRHVCAAAEAISLTL